ncbi:hypothetical protein PFISCL1PPCAC_10015, partial [Pristionchus fissidentatus]
MGARCAKRRRHQEGDKPCLAHFSIIRSIGRGAFGKVCIVQHRCSHKLYAMKYMSKERCIRQSMADNVLKELSIVTTLDHPFIVNLQCSFQDARCMYIVSDLLLGGDLRYHLNQRAIFKEDRSKLYFCEIALAVDYLHSRSIVHRDIKPDNIILDERGHAHLTDFNLATRLETGSLATSFSGTRVYMAPELFSTCNGSTPGYDQKIDWYSLGATLHEMLRGRPPHQLPSTLNSHQVLMILHESPLELPSDWSSDLISFVSRLLSFSPQSRLSSLDAIKAHPYCERIDFAWIHARRAAPTFVPSQHCLNCDPVYEIEERVVVSTPIHDRRRTTRNNSKSGSSEVESAALDSLTASFIEYNR